MANGRPDRHKDYCDYPFLDGTYCPIQIERITETINGKQLEKNKWEDAQKRNFCIFHSDNNEKAGELYSRLRKIIHEENKSIINYHDGFKLSNISEEEKKKKIDEVRSNYKIVLEGCYFPEDILFQKFIFESDVTFQKCIFKGNISFYMTEFGGKANFREVEFRGDSNFSNVIFHNDALFENVEFYGKADFFNVKFNGMSAFSSAHFGINKKLNGDAIFTGTKFSKQSFFNHVKFHKKSFFRSGEFNGDTSFKNAIFGEVTDFDGVQFKENVDFSFSVFDDTASFIGSLYVGGVSFKESLFKSNTSFSYSNFLKKLDFSDAIFLNGDLKFTRSKFPPEEIYFLNTIFNCKVLFHEQMLKGVRFTGCYLGSASFYGSDVRDVVFINSSWNRKFLERQVQKLIEQKRVEKIIPVLEISRITAGSNRGAILLDELIYSNSKTMNVFEKRKIWISFGFLLSYRGIKKSLRNFLKKQKKTYLPCYNLEPSRLELDPLYLEHLYCQFKLAMDRNKMYGLANDFYYGEKLMETKRLWEEGSLLKWSFLKLYKLLSGFGNSPWRAIISLILILFASSFLLIKFNGLNAEKPKEAYERCPCERNETKPAAAIKQNLKTPSTSTKAGKSNKSTLLNKNLVGANAPNQSSSSPQTANASKKANTKKEAGYSLKDDYWCNAFYVSLWNLTASPGRRSGDYKENGIWVYLAIFFIQYVFRPLMVALIIISVRRKVYRG